MPRKPSLIVKKLIKKGPQNYNVACSIMNKKGPIIVIEDDLDDQMLLDHVFKKIEIENQVIYFADPEEALNYLYSSLEQPFLILSDINMPKLNGMELKEKIQENEALRAKCIPYLFFTTTAEQKMVINAYSKSAQGFFVKPADFGHLQRIIQIIIDYWKECHSPDVVA